MTYNYSQDELMRLTGELRRGYDGFADTVRAELTKGVGWDDGTARELIDNIATEANGIKDKQTDYLLRGSCGIFDAVLYEEFSAYQETVRLISEDV